MDRYRTEILVSLALVLGTLIAFGHVCFNDYIDLDDDDYIVMNPYVRDGMTGKNLAWAFTTFHAANWHPLTWLSLQLDREIYGLDSHYRVEPAGVHLTNLLLHAANTVLLFVVLRRMTGAVWRSALVAALFALHPLHVESVAWATERKDVLSTFFWMLTLLAYVFYAEKPSLVRYLPVCLAFVLGLLAKPMLVTLPFVLLLLDYWPLRRWSFVRRAPAAKNKKQQLAASEPKVPSYGLQTLLLKKLPLFALVAASCVVTVIAQKEGGAVETLEGVPLAIRLGNAVVAYATYIIKMFWSADLAVLYPHPGSGLPWWQVAVAGLLLAGISFSVYKTAPRQPYLAVGWLWYLGTLVPVIGLVQVGVQAWADRYSYVPLIGLFLMLSWGVADLFTAWRVERVWRVGLAGAVLGVCTVLTWMQVRHWYDALTLWQHTVRVTADNPIAQGNLGLHLLRRGENEEAKRHFAAALHGKPDSAFAHNCMGLAYLTEGNARKAEDYFRQALHCNPKSADSHDGLGNALMQQGKIDEALKHYYEAYRLNPNLDTVRCDLAVALLLEDKRGEALEKLHEARQARPDMAVVLNILGFAFELQGDLTEAVASYREAVRLGPTSFKYHADLAGALWEQGETEAAKRHYREATQLAPGWPEQYNRQARAMATSADPKRHIPIKALQLAKQACQTTDHQRPEFLDTLAAAYAADRQFDKAVVTIKEALALASSSGQPEKVKQMAERLRLYESGQPFREPAGSRP